MNKPIQFLGLTRARLVLKLGEPDAKGGMSRKYPIPSVYKYGDIEYHFGPGAHDTLWLVWDDGNETTLAKM